MKHEATQETESTAIELSGSPKALPAGFRQTVFTFQDGLMLCLLVSACCRGGFLAVPLEEGEQPNAERARFPESMACLSVSELAGCYGANPAYLGVALRCFAQQGWLSRTKTESGEDWIYRPTEKFRCVRNEHLDIYRRLGDFLAVSLPFEQSLLSFQNRSDLRQQFGKWVEEACDGWNAAGNRSLQNHLTGALVVPLMVALLQTDLLEASPIRLETALPEAAILLELEGWLDRKRQTWTPEGELARDHALYFGMVCSYIPMLVRLHGILFGNSGYRTHAEIGQTEIHVDRKLNILASGAAHRKYFADLDEIFVEIFNKEPIESQPQFVMDTGCGDGSWLKHIHQLVSGSTKRGQALARYPLLMIGVDYNTVCEDICLSLLHEASIPALFLTGDVTDPAGIAKILESHNLSMNRGLHVRSFIDHNRLFEQPSTLSSTSPLLPSGAYVGEDQSAISDSGLRRNLVEFLRKWSVYADPHGLVVLEGHCIDPAITARYPGHTHSLVFDTYHGFSHQYPVDFEVFMEAALEAGLHPVIYQQQRYPSRKPFVAISANHFKVASDTARDPIPKRLPGETSPGPQWLGVRDSQREDGAGLHKLLYADGELHRPRPWCHAATGLLLRPVLKELNRLLDQIDAGIRNRREIHLVDYGAGTGMATMELLRACQDNGFLDRCADLGVRFRLSLLDIPSGWFEKAFDLLGECPYVEFHSIRDPETGRFLPLSSLIASGNADVVMASMVFHLIRPEPLRLVFQNLASLLGPAGKLFWNSPDIGPANPGSVLFHEANRRLRRLVCAFLDDPGQLSTSRWFLADACEVTAVMEALQEVRNQLTDAERERAKRLADAQILPRPNLLRDILELAMPEFETIHSSTASFEIHAEEVVDTLLVPSNQRYLSEISSRPLREQVIRGLMTWDIIPTLHEGPAGTLQGYSVHWTLGALRKRG